MKTRIEAYGPLVLKLYKHLDREIRFPPDLVEWWTHVALRSAAAGAALMLGGYRMDVAERGQRRPGEPPLSDPVGRFALVVDDHEAMRAAYRVGLWAYMAEFNAELWAREYEAELHDTARVLTVASAEEQRVCDLGRELLASGAAPPAVAVLLRFRYGVFAALLAAATRIAVSADDPSLEAAAPAWLKRYGDGKASAAERVKELALHDLPVPVW